MDSQASQPNPETANLLREGHSRIFAKVEKTSDETDECFNLLRRGITRARNSQDAAAFELLTELGAQWEVMHFLAVYATERKKCRSQVAEVFRTLLAQQRWADIAAGDSALCAQMPEGVDVDSLLKAAAQEEQSTEAHTEEGLSSPDHASAVEACSDEAAVCEGDAPGATVTAEAAVDEASGNSSNEIMTVSASAESDVCVPTKEEETTLNMLKAAFHALRESEFSCSKSDVVESVTLFQRAVNRILAGERLRHVTTHVLDSLEPKVPLLRLLCELHSARPVHRRRVESLLRDLLSRELWREAAEADEEAKNALSELDVLRFAVRVDMAKHRSRACFDDDEVEANDDTSYCSPSGKTAGDPKLVRTHRSMALESDEPAADSPVTDAKALNSVDSESEDDDEDAGGGCGNTRSMITEFRPTDECDEESQCSDEAPVKKKTIASRASKLFKKFAPAMRT